MEADGDHQTQLTSPRPTGREQGSQPSWFPDASGFLFRRSGNSVRPAVWRIGPWGEDPMQVFSPDGRQFYPSWSRDMSRILFAWTRSEPLDTDRAIAISAPTDPEPTILFDDPGVFDSAPAWSPDGARIAFESDTKRLGTNPEGDREIFVMNADGSAVQQLTRNSVHDEGPAWSPDGTMLALTSGRDNEHGDIQVMTAGGVHLRQLTTYDGLDESPDWQAIPAPETDRRCGDLEAETVTDVRAAGDGLGCDKARALAAAWTPGDRPGGRPHRVQGFDAEREDFGGVLRVVLTHRGARDDETGNEKLVAFLHQP
jgi:Tol biopolymer transport system component